MFNYLPSRFHLGFLAWSQCFSACHGPDKPVTALSLSFPLLPGCWKRSNVNMRNIGGFHGKRPQLIGVLLLFHRDLQEEIWRGGDGKAERTVCQAVQGSVLSLWEAFSQALLLPGTAGQWVGPFLSHIPANPGCQNGFWGAPALPQGFFSVALQKADIGIGILSHSFPVDDKHLGILHQPLSKPYQTLGINGKGRKMRLRQLSCSPFFVI